MLENQNQTSAEKKVKCFTLIDAIEAIEAIGAIGV